MARNLDPIVICSYCHMRPAAYHFVEWHGAVTHLCRRCHGKSLPRRRRRRDLPGQKLFKFAREDER